MQYFIFDVDGVLTDIGQPIDLEFQRWLIDFFKGRHCHLITGNTRDKTIRRIGYELVEISKVNFFSMGNEIAIQYKKPFFVNQFTLKEEEEKYLKELARLSAWPNKTNNHFDMRNGSLNFSVIGVDASDKEKKAYEQYDLDSNERKNIIKEFKENFPRFDAFVGGRASIDICLRGAHKGQILPYMPHPGSLVFFGDKCNLYEIDYYLASQITNTYKITNGYKETWEILKSL